MKYLPADVDMVTYR